LENEEKYKLLCQMRNIENVNFEKIIKFSKNRTKFDKNKRLLIEKKNKLQSDIEEIESKSDTNDTGSIIMTHYNSVIQYESYYESC